MSGTPAIPRTRVVLVINDLRRAGAETQLVRLATGLDPARYDASIVLLKSQNDFDADLRAARIPVVALGRSSRWDFGVVWRLRRQLRLTSPNVVNSFLSFANLVSVLAARPLAGSALVLSQRSSYEATMTPFWRGVARWAHRQADGVVVNSAAVWREEIAAGFTPERIRHVPNGIRTPMNPEPRPRPSLGLPPTPLVVCVAQFAPEKGHRDLIAAWSSVREARPDAILVLVGDGALRSAIEGQIAAQGLQGAVRLVGHQQGAEPFLAAADVVVLPSHTEGMPNVVLEAMALGRPIVATAVGGIPELIDSGVSGTLVPASRPEALADALRAVLADPALAAALGERARARAADFSVERMVAATEACYAEALASRERRSVAR